MNLTTSNTIIDCIDQKIELEPEYADLVDISLVKDKNELISEIYIVLHNEISPQVYKVILGELLIRNEKILLLEKIDFIREFLETKEKSNRNHLIYTLDPFFTGIYNFILWAWSELNLSLNGTMSGLEELESKLNELMTHLCEIRIDNRKQWTDIQNYVLKIIKDIKLQSIKNKWTLHSHKTS